MKTESYTITNNNLLLCCFLFYAAFLFQFKKFDLFWKKDYISILKHLQVHQIPQVGLPVASSVQSSPLHTCTSKGISLLMICILL